MKRDSSESARWEAQQLTFDATDADSIEETVKLCRQALKIYPDCADALGILAGIECRYVKDHVQAMRKAVEAGRRDLGKDYFREVKGMFWGEIDSRPFMRAMSGLADSLVKWGQPEHLDEAIGIYEEMLELNPNDNQGVRDPLAGLYLRLKRYDEAENLFKRYKDDWMAVTCWGKVLLAYATQGEKKAAAALKNARKQNPHVEKYLTGQKRRPRSRPDYYSPGEETEALFCVDTLMDAWKKHPNARQWLKNQA